jgi:hypothetical protein
MPPSLLDRLLDDNARFDLGGRGTVNHLPMVLIALSRMGASDERLTEYFRWWEDNRALPRRESSRQVEHGQWQQYIGDGSMFAALSDYFQQRILDSDSAEVITAVFPAISRGVGAAAFHGLIRLAYGIEVDHPGEIAAGLATLCSRYVDLRLSSRKAPSSTTVAAAFRRIADAVRGSSFTGQGIIGRMVAAASDARLRAAFSVPPTKPDLLDEIARAGITLYWRQPNFTILHMVTATHAARTVLGRFPDLASQDAILALWGAVCSAYASVGAPLLGEVEADADLPPWDQIFREAVNNNDDHVIKMTYTCHCEGQHYCNALYHVAAARLVATGSSMA